MQLLRAFGCDEKYPKLFLFHFKKWTAQKIYKSKYIPAQTTFRQQKDNLNYNSTTRIYNFFFQRMKKRRKKKISPYKNKSLSEEEEEE